MLHRILNMFRVPDLRNKILFTLFIIMLYRLGSFIPAPGIDLDAVEALKDQIELEGGVLGFINLFSGGALTQMAVFALGIMPYITSSIIMQVLAVVIPRLEEWQKQGAVGQRKITQWTRYLTVAIAVLQSTGLVFLFHNGGGGFLGGVIDRPRPGAQLLGRQHRPHRADAHRRHRPPHVDGRAHHPAGHRQRHVAPDHGVGGGRRSRRSSTTSGSRPAPAPSSARCCCS